VGAGLDWGLWILEPVIGLRFWGAAWREFFPLRSTVRASNCGMLKLMPKRTVSKV
jgi:hypothetical protein